MLSIVTSSRPATAACGERFPVSQSGELSQVFLCARRFLLARRRVKRSPVSIAPHKLTTTTGKRQTSTSAPLPNASADIANALPTTTTDSSCRRVNPFGCSPVSIGFDIFSPFLPDWPENSCADARRRKSLTIDRRATHAISAGRLASILAERIHAHFLADFAN